MVEKVDQGKRIVGEVMHRCKICWHHSRLQYQSTNDKERQEGNSLDTADKGP